MKKTIPVVGLACSACSAHVEQKLASLKGVREASVSLLLRSATVDFDPEEITLEEMKNEINGIGYDLIVEDGASAVETEKRVYTVLRRRAVAAWVLAIAVMSVSMHWVEAGDADMSNQLMLLLALASILFCGRQFYVSAYKSMLHARGNMDTLVALSTGITFLFSVFNTFFGAAVWGVRGMEWHTYFDTPAMIIAFVLTGRLIEERAKEGVSSSIRQLMGIAPRTARIVDTEEVKDDAGNVATPAQVREIPISTIRKGDLLEVRAGDKIPADGCIIAAESFMSASEVYIDESMITGEPSPAGKKKGDKALAGTIVSQGKCVVEARLTGGETALERIISVVRETLASKAPVQRVVDRMAAVFVPVVAVIAIITFLSWLVAGGTACLPRAIMCAMAVMVIACPCAMGLATPAALMAGIGRAAKKHILIKDAAAVETLHRVNALVVDKTGTLTIPNANIDFTKAGSLPFEERETLKPNVRETVAALEKDGTNVYMMSGDSEEAVAYWAEKAGISRWQSRVSPEDKQALVRRLQGEGKTVAMLGDGINDTQALVAADVSIAVDKGTDVAMDLSQAVIMGDDIRAVADAISISRATVRMIRQNLFWAFVYNIVCIPLAAGLPFAFGMQWSISPAWASALMALSGISVVFNSLRINAK